MIWKKFFAKSLFFRLMASFLLMIVIISSFFIISFSLYVNNLQSQLVSNIQGKFEVTCNKYDYEFEKVTDTLYRLYTDDYFKPVLSSKKMTYLDMFHLENLMHSYISLNEGINTIFLISNNSDLVITSTGTFSMEDFFNKFYSSTSYSFGFWDKEQQKKFNYYFYNFYTPAPFVDLSDPGIYNKQLMPVAFKQNQDSDFIMVALVDMQVISSGIDGSFLQNFIILNANGAPVYTSLDPGGPVVKLAEDGGKRSRDGYFLSQDSQQNGIRYYRYLPNLEMRDMLIRMNAIIVVILCLSILISVVLSYLISRSTNNLARKIVDIMGAAAGEAPGAASQTDLQHIRSSVQTIVEQNSRYSSEIKSKDLILEDFFYRTKLKDIHVQFDESADQFTIRSNFILVCFTLHYYEFAFERAGGTDQSRDTFRIKELLGHGVKKYYSNCITF
jgi:two-component system, response regulator YesN